MVPMIQLYVQLGAVKHPETTAEAVLESLSESTDMLHTAALIHSCCICPLCCAISEQPRAWPHT